MFIIFGWNHQDITPYGPVEKIECQNCHNTEFWHLNKIKRFFTLFFIPIFPHSKDYWYYCPICNYGNKLNSDEFQTLKSISEINKNFLDNLISEEERKIKIEAIYDSVAKNNNELNQKIIDESKSWTELVKIKTNDELDMIINHPKEYNPSLIIAAELEIEKRNSSKFY